MKKWFLNLKISHKILCLTAIFLFMFIFTGGIDFFVVHKVSKNFETMYDNNLQSIEHISNSATQKAEMEKAKTLYEKNKSIEAFALTAVIALYSIAIILFIVLGQITANIIAKPISKVVNNLTSVSEGNFRVEKLKSDATTDEPGILISTLNKTVENLKNFISSVKNSSDSVNDAANQIAQSSEQTAGGAQQVASSVTQFATGTQEQACHVTTILENINEMDKTIESISKSLISTVELSENTTGMADEGQANAENAIEKIQQIKDTFNNVSGGINELGDYSKEIGQIVEIIRNIAAQTSLLALNAAIEAARAGEQGKGFAVVADEVKKLAEESSKATTKITDMIRLMQEKTTQTVETMGVTVTEVDSGVEIIEKTGDSLREIHSYAKTTNQNIEKVNKEVQGLITSSEEVLKMAENISAVTEESAASAEQISTIVQEQTAGSQEINASVQNLASIAEDLRNQLEQFKV